jgi:hypothetical protein
MRLRIRRGWKLGVVFACLAATTFVGAQAPATTGTGAISGVVVDAVTGRPLAGASVALGRLDVQRPAPRMVTDSKGRFIFHNLPPSAEYFLDARTFGYANTRYGWAGPDGSSAISAIRRIPVADGQWVSTIKIPLWRYGAISGRVVDERGEPVVGVVVRAFGFNNIAGQAQLVGGALATTDDRGIYRLSGVKPGRYVVSVLSVQSTVLSTTPEGPPIRAVGELESGGYAGGRGAIVTAPGIDVDGRHRLVVTNFATPPPPAAGGPRAYPAVFYPGVARAADAEAIEMGYGGSRTGVDFQLRPVAGVRVTGRLESRSTMPASLLLRLMPTGSERLGPGSEAATTTSDRDGSFTFLNVPEGNYTLIAQASIVEVSSGGSSLRLAEPPGFPAGGISIGSSRGAPGLSQHVRSGQPSAVSGRMAVGVGNTDLTNLVVTLTPSVKISGRVEFAEGAPPENLHLSLEALTVDGDLSLGQPRGSGVATQTGMTFEVPGLLGGRYILNAGRSLISTPGVGMSGYDGPLAVMSIMSGGRDVVETGFDGSLGVDFDDVVITLTTKVPTLEGVVRAGDGPAPGVVIAFPVERERWVGYGLEPRRLRTAPAGLDGKFKMGELPQGDYFLVAVDAKEAEKWVDPKFLAAAAPFATRVALKWGAAITQDLKLVEVVVK